MYLNSPPTLKTHDDDDDEDKDEESLGIATAANER